MNSKKPVAAKKPPAKKSSKPTTPAYVAPSAFTGSTGPVKPAARHEKAPVVPEGADTQRVDNPTPIDGWQDGGIIR